MSQFHIKPGGFSVEHANLFRLFSFSRGLADCDKDGSLNFNEFSIACKLITMKLKGFELPKVLPPVLLSTVMSPMAAGSPGIPAAPMTSYQQGNSLTSPVLSQVSPGMN